MYLLVFFWHRKQERAKHMGESTERKALFIATVGGFVTQFEMNNVRILKQMGYEIHSAANFKEPVYCVKERELKEQGVILHHVDIAKSPFLWYQNLYALRQICGIIRENRITLIHCHTPVGGVLGRLAGIWCGSPGLKVIYTAHGFHFYQGAPWVNWLIYYHVERFLAHFTDCIVTINQEDYEKACRFRMRKGGRVYRIPGEGLDLGRFSFRLREKKQELRKKLGIPEDAFVLLSVGELSGNKNHRQIIRLIPTLQEKLLPRKVHYGICGDGFYHRELEDEIRQLGLEGQVRLYGCCQDVEEFLACADCFVFPSFREGLGMAALEALAMGVPVVASDNRGTREYMEDGVNGFVCRTGKSEEFIQKVAEISRLSEEELQAMGLAGCKTAGRFGRIHTDGIMREIYRGVDGARKEEWSLADTRRKMIEGIPGESRFPVLDRRAVRHSGKVQ